ncbi:hypothetical protein [Streptomyces mirabilis]
MSDTLLPEAFAEPEPFAATWCLATEPERYERRLASDMTELPALYDVGRCPEPARRPPEPSRPTTHDHRDPHARCRRERCTR